MNDTPSLHLWLIPVLPFIGFLLNGLLGSRLPKTLVSTIALLFTAAPLALVTIIAFRFTSLSLPYVERLPMPWMATPAFHADFAFLLDPLTLVMLLVVTGVGFLIHIYSVGYMAHEEGYWRFFAYLNLFMFFMLTLVLAENFLIMFVGWEGVGLASYLLVGFYFLKESAADAGKKAFILNRIGDFGFLLAMFLMIAHFGSLSFSSVFGAISHHPEVQGGFLTAIALLLLLGATGKSAQIPLYIWLPDAMEGPTPVSALIHAATMVTAGVYMIARSHVLFDRSPFALGVVAIIGAATALFAATVGMVQTDIKRVLAYSTISQLGYMFLACGAAAYSAAIFHLVTHAFFKALLFLAAGSVIHALGGQQDMRAMGGLRTATPITFWTMSSAVFAISGVPPFSGFFSKDAILYQTFVSPTAGPILWVVGVVTVSLTAFYMFRLWYLTFFGAIRTKDAHPHEGPWSMLVPIMILGVLALAGGWIGIPKALGGGDQFAHFLDPVLHVASAPASSSGNQEIWFSVISVAMAAIGWFFADLLYRRKPGMADRLAERAAGVYSLLVNKYWIDQIYTGLIVAPLLFLSRYLLWGAVDRGVINGGGSLAAGSMRGLGALVQRVQSGNIRSYAGWLAVGAAALLLITYFGFSMHLS
ncbi:MAG TPA: NADH-quinone oxidoreductase subunit L [Acidobacteriaceae bacterium]|jgi:NADH-quinone oxidoreductase subunit L|nr:NADH-quinone oxidoreductase subunit L [Acidobacteriaceae bacterium]